MLAPVRMAALAELAGTTVPVFKKYVTRGRLTNNSVIMVDGKRQPYTMGNTFVSFLRNAEGNIFLHVVDPFGLNIKRLPVTPDTDPVLAESNLPDSVTGQGTMVQENGEHATHKFIAVGTTGTGEIRVDCKTDLAFYLSITPATEERAHMA